MSFLENNSRQIAAILCTASAFPIVSTVMAMEMQPGWKAEKYLTADGMLASGWHEIEGEVYYFDESGTVDRQRSSAAKTASLELSVNEAVAESVKETLEEKTSEAELQQVQELEAVQEEVFIVAEAMPVIEPVIEEAIVEMEAPVIEEVETIVPEVQEPVHEEVYVPEVQEPVHEEVYVPEVQEPVYEEVYVPEVQEPVHEEVYVPENNGSNEYVGDINQQIANAAMGLVGTTNGQQCTEVATQALQGAGVSASVLWPDQYVMYGYYTDTPVAGNLIYYDNGGRGLDHIAVYIGDDMAVHGNYMGQTVIAPVSDGGVGAPQYIQIVA